MAQTIIWGRALNFIHMKDNTSVFNGQKNFFFFNLSAGKIIAPSKLVYFLWWVKCPMGSDSSLVTLYIYSGQLSWFSCIIHCTFDHPSLSQEFLDDKIHFINSFSEAPSQQPKSRPAASLLWFLFYATSSSFPASSRFH